MDKIYFKKLNSTIFAKRVIWFIQWSLVSLSLCWFAILNGYPILMANDSKAYLVLDTSVRSNVYGIFAHLTSLGISFWFTIVFQSVLLSFLLLQTVQKFNNFSQLKWNFLLMIAAVLITPVSIYVSSIHPDIFLAVAFLSYFLFVVEERSIVRIVYLTIFILALSFHMSFVLVGLLTVLSSIIFLRYIYFSVIDLLFSFFAITFAIVIIMFGTVANTGKFELPSQSHRFYIAGLVKDGILTEHFEEHCEEKKYILCDHWDKSFFNNSNDFLWNKKAEKGTKTISDILSVYSNELIENEYKRILIDVIFSSPLKVVGVISSEMYKSFNLLNPKGHLIKYSLGGYPLKQLKKISNNDFQMFIHGVQIVDIKKLQNIFSVIVVYQNFLMKISFFILMLSVVNRSIFKNKNLCIFSYLLCIFILSNSFVSVTFSDMFVRYFARIHWLFIYTAFLLVMNMHQAKKD